MEEVTSLKRFVLGYEAPLDRAVWRYFSFERFLDVLDSQTLYFASAEQFDDIFEGGLTKPDAVRRFSVLNPRAAKRAQGAVDPSLMSLDCFERLREYAKISCWHLSEHESAAMWKLYALGGKGVAVKSTVGNLFSSLGEYRIEKRYGAETLWFGQVRYLDYESQSLPGADSDIGRFFCKRQSFSFEAEFRVMTSLRMASEFCGDIPRSGVRVPVNLQTLIQHVFISPWPTFAGADTKVLEALKKVGLEVPVRHSSLADSPIY